MGGYAIERTELQWRDIMNTSWYHTICHTRTPNMSFSMTVLISAEIFLSFVIRFICCLHSCVFTQGTNTERPGASVSHLTTIRTPSGFKSCILRIP